MVFRLLIIALMALLAGCSGDEAEDIMKEIYVGSMFFDINPGVIGRSFEDTVQLTIEGTAYDFETLVHTVTHWSPLCDVAGNVSGFGGTSSGFTVVEIDRPGNMETALLSDINGDGHLDILPAINRPGETDVTTISIVRFSFSTANASAM